MKILKNIIVGFLNLILIDLIILLVLNITLKDFMINDIIIESFKSNSGIIDINNESSPFNMNNEVVKETLEDEELKGLLNEFVEDIITNISEEEKEEINVDELEKKVIEYVKENKENIKEKTGVEVTDEMINDATEKLEEGDIKNSINQKINNYKNNMTNEEKFAFKLYNFITSNDLKIILIISIIIDIILIALVQKSIYKWIRTVSRSMIISGLSILILALSIKYLISTLTLTIITPKNILFIGIIIMVFGIIINIIYRLMTKYYIKEK